MTGVIAHLKKFKGGYFFIEGDDGVRYYSHAKYIKNKNDNEYWCEGYWLSTYDVYGYEGNYCAFDISEDEKDKDGCPVAVNVTLDTTEYDPRLHEKLLTKRRDEENRARHEKNRIKETNRKMAKEIELKRYIKK